MQTLPKRELFFHRLCLRENFSHPDFEKMGTDNIYENQYQNAHVSHLPFPSNGEHKVQFMQP